MGNSELKSRAKSSQVTVGACSKMGSRRWEVVAVLRAQRQRQISNRQFPTG